MAVSWVREREGLIKVGLGKEKAVCGCGQKARKMKWNRILGGVSIIVLSNPN